MRERGGAKGMKRVFNCIKQLLPRNLLQILIEQRFYQPRMSNERRGMNCCKAHFDSVIVHQLQNRTVKLLCANFANYLSRSRALFLIGAVNHRLQLLAGSEDSIDTLIAYQSSQQTCSNLNAVVFEPMMDYIRVKLIADR